MAALADLAVELPRVRQRSPCHVCAGDGVVDGRRCTEPGIWTDIADVEWSSCPFGLMATPHWHALISVDAAAMVSPLEHWPSGWSAWVADGMLALRGARHRAEERAMKRARST